MIAMGARPPLLLLVGLVVVAGLAPAQPARAADKPASEKVFSDPEDHKLDASEWLLDRKGFLPVPIVITEPAVGYGGGIALAFFRGSLREAEAQSQAKGGRLTAPDIYGAALAGTENGTQFGGAGARVNFDQDRWRWLGAAGYADANLTFYGIGGEIGTGDEKIGFNLDGWLSSQQILRRIGRTNQHVGARWVYLDLKHRFDDDRPEPVLDDEEQAARDSGVGVSWEYDSRDTIFTATRGVKAEVETLFYETAFGGE
ncbi:MAG TPA: glyceraldehyde-3-phosphate dehydrogenase, partial [Candidatus Polarisedimenticolia bacterium]|nr:glyceraldehyde-3-phosphate dehydrogenase [Candidatus Polarisedimenticolia bacterium]